MPVWPPLRPPPNSFGEDLVLGCGRRGTCGAPPDRPRRQMASRYAYHHPHPQAVPQRHSNVSPRGWPDGRFGHHSPPSPPPAQPPHQLCASHRPVCALRSTQYGGSDHRRPSNLETGAPVPTPFAPKTPPSTKVSLYVFLHLHSSFTGYPVAWVTKPHPSPPHRPPRWLLPTTTLCSAETDPNSPRCPCPSPLPANAE